jgi:type III restriction enzyme
MNRHVNAIAARLSLRQPQRQSLEILDRVTEIVPPRKADDIAAALEIIKSEFPTVTDFERDFPSLCFALATGVGKTRLMGAFIAYLHLAHGINNFFVMAPNLTIYNKLITDFTPNTPKYVFKGIAEFAQEAPEIITGDNYQEKAGTLFDEVLRCKINIFNISKINSEVRGGKAPKIKRLSEYIGESYFEYLAGLPDLVLLMDESHRYRASAGVRAINELKPVLGLEFTATPFTEGTGGKKEAFKNVILDYPLAMAMKDGFVKEPAVATQRNFDKSKFTDAEIEKIKLEDGIRLHEDVKVHLETYARETNQKIVKPFVLVIARDTTHAASLLNLIQSKEFFEGRYKGKVIQVDSSKTGAEEEEMINRLLKVEQSDEPTEIVIHVNMLKEGWDVTNLYTIIPLRAANAHTLIEQTIGRGLRLPYGKRTGVKAVDRLSIVAHDKFQEIVDEANKPESSIRLEKLILEPPETHQKLATVVTNSTLEVMLGAKAVETTSKAIADSVARPPEPTFKSEAELKVAQATVDAIRKLEQLPNSKSLLREEIQKKLVEEVTKAIAPAQTELSGIVEPVDVKAVVAKTTNLAIQQTIDIPRINVFPQDVSSGFHPFLLDTASIHLQPTKRDVLVQNLRTHEQEVLSASGTIQEELRLEDYIVRSLIDFDDISYDHHSDLLYELAGQMVRHLQSYLKDEKEVLNVLHYQHRTLAEAIHAQMLTHYWEKATGYEVVVSKGFTELIKPAATSPDEAVRNFRRPVEEKSKIAQYLFGGFDRCLFPVTKFQSDPERVLSVILERDSIKWFRPAQGQFQIFYKDNGKEREYQPDFVAETDAVIYMMEPKATNEMNDPIVQAKMKAAVEWCKNASTHNQKNGGKPWRYLLIPHKSINESMTIDGLAAQYRA